MKRMKRSSGKIALAGMLCLAVLAVNWNRWGLHLQTQKMIQECVLRMTQAEMNAVVDFQIVAENRAYVGSTIRTASVVLKQVTYADGTVQDTVSSGFSPPNL